MSDEQKKRKVIKKFLTMYMYTKNDGGVKKSLGEVTNYYGHKK